MGVRRTEDLVGQRFGKLLVVEYLTEGQFIHQYRCVCNCGRMVYRGQCRLRGYEQCQPCRRAQAKELTRTDTAIGARAVRHKILERVKKSASGCWEWQLTLVGAGYGVFRINGNRTTAHRAAYEAWLKPIPQ